MNTKNKLIALVQIAVVLCSLFLVALPAIAAEQNHGMQKVSISAITTASEDDYVLGIYGNANEDDTIDMGDVVYTKLAIFGKKPKTELCDAKYDGRINVLDVIQTKLIILGKEKELTVIDSDDIIVTVKKPVERLVVLGEQTVEIIRSIHGGDKIVGVSGDVLKRKIFFAEFADCPSVGSDRSPDYEAILNLQPDLVIGRKGSFREKIKELDPNIAAGLFREFDLEGYTELIRKLGYILDKEDVAEEFCDWYEGYMNTIKDTMEKIPEEDKPKVYYETWKPYYTGSGKTVANLLIVAAGGKNIFSDHEFPDTGWGSSWGQTSAEDVISRNPDIIIRALGHGYTKCYFSDDLTTTLSNMRDEIMNRPELANVNAVKNGKVYVICNAVLGEGSPGGGFFLGVAYEAKLFHPDLFEDFDPQAIHQEYLDRFQRIDYDLDEHGIFVYPPFED